LTRAIDTVGPVEAGIEPLRRIGRGALGGEHVAKLVHEGLRVSLRVEIAALPAPIGPGAGKPVEDLARVGLRTVALILGQFGQRLLVGDRAPEEGGPAVLLDLLLARGHTGVAEIFLRQDVACDLGDLRRHVNIFEPEDHRAIRVPDLAYGLAERDLRVRGLAFLREPAFDAHLRSSSIPNIASIARQCSSQSNDGPALPTTTRHAGAEALLIRFLSHATRPCPELRQGPGEPAEPQ